MSALKRYLAEGALVVAGTLGMWLFGTVKHQAEDVLLGNCVMVVLMLALSCFHLHREYRNGTLEYDNGEHIYRFMLCLCAGLFIALSCGFLPVGGWPFLLVFVMLSLFSNLSVGILAGASLLLISVLLSGCGVNGFVLYFVSGVFAVSMFRHLGEDFKIGIPFFLSMFCLLVCETANLILMANARPDFEMFVVPLSNMIISSILLFGCLKLFSSTVVYRYRERYLDICDTEYPVLVELREGNRKEYMHSIHATYFCERIGKLLGMDTEALKCAGYYYRVDEEQVGGMIEGKKFPPLTVEILRDYDNRQQGIKKKETAVLYCADTIVSSVTYMQEKSGQRQVDYDKLVDAVFKKMFDDGIFDRCEISLYAIRAMQKLFKEEKLYYDFFH